MRDRSSSCALLADRHNFLNEGVRDLLETVFSTIFVVADVNSLLEGVARLQPAVVVMDLSLATGDGLALLRRVHEGSAESKLLVLSVHDDPSITRLSLEAGAHGVVLKRAIATDLLAAVDTVLDGQRYVSSGIALKSLGKSMTT